MGLFDFLKRKDATAAFPLPFPYQVLPKGLKGKKLLQLWKDAERSKGQPVLLVMDDNLREMLKENSSFAPELVDLDQFLRARQAEYSEFLDEGLFGTPADTADGYSSFEEFGIHDGSNTVLAYIQVSEPWEIFRQLPIGGWNECPDTNVIMSFCKYLYSQYGAVPARISGDTLELIPARKPSPGEAQELAMQMYLFCPDIVEQGDESISALANSLTKSDIWFFWWD